ncbi:MAG: hypothetical protein LUD74_00755, partial [Tannerellaceae bacterium]|nr:hypothetical protein [Tannerellaceae bacterium]
DVEKWKTGTTDAQPNPMCGEVTGGSAGITIKPGEAPFSNVTLQSMLVRINLTNNEDEEIFQLQEVYLYHIRRNGLIIPGQTTPSLPSTPVRHSEPMQYSTGNNEIYIFEQDRSNGEEESNMPFMIIGGDYAKSGVTTWYRIDFVNRIENETKNEFIDLTRNHGYNIIISQVKAKGYETREQAAQCLPVNTVTEILKFDDGDVENILFDGKYYLAISLETIQFDKNAGSTQLKVKTDNPLGWKIQQQGGTDWLRIDRTEPSGPTDDGELTVQVDQHNQSQARTAAFNISAGRL